ncbi:YheC/YheD family protein [Metabacillus fastidiosus]|uniref:YheC/YheD family protein n=1 Tax=Metabacillus fastidiosus TaxID=1458 RepID=UPI002DBD4393|nr:YheC/YheD family protein [Metabacillus fastidiosus]MEC2076324.1 YheC/YheD family protein [Metabacillus fastidiosus]
MKASKGKWEKYNIMKKDREIAKHLPDTRILTDESLWEMVKLYRCVVIKPSCGSFGSGIIKVSLLVDSSYEVHFENKRKIFHNKEQALEYIKEIRLPQKSYIVQQWIPLAVTNKPARPFDLRIMVQRMKKSPDWVMTGHLAKVAARGYFITNVVKTIIPIQEAIDGSPVKSNIKSTSLLDIERLALRATSQLEKHSLNSRNIGLDMAFDKNGYIWIIEVNLRPHIEMFKYLKNEDMYNMVKFYKKGRAG